MNTYKLTLLKGDGIGPEIVREAVKVLDAAAARYGFALSYTDALMGGCAIDAAGTPLPGGNCRCLQTERRRPAGGGRRLQMGYFAGKPAA